MNAALGTCDALVLPTAPTAAFAPGERRDDPLRMYRSDVLTVPASLAGLPAVSVPTGLDPDGLPLSLQIIGRYDGESDLLRLAGLVEVMRGFLARREAPWRR